MTVEDRARIDVWLWRARFFKTRSQAAEFVAAGRVRLFRAGAMRRLDKPAYLIALGDLVSFARDGRSVAIVVRALGARRGPPAEARLLFEETPQAGAVDEAGAPGHVTIQKQDRTP
jgi:ribosomal 50S subunit-recycling heat shock protein